VFGFVVKRAQGYLVYKFIMQILNLNGLKTSTVSTVLIFFSKTW